MAFQLLIGLPLEMVHKFHRVGFVYVFGVIAGFSRVTTNVWMWGLGLKFLFGSLVTYCVYSYIYIYIYLLYI